MATTIQQIATHLHNGTLTRAILNHARRKLGLSARPAPKQPSELRRTTNAHLRPLCRDVTGSVLSIGEGHGRDSQGGGYRDYFPACGRYVRMEYDKGWGGSLPAEIYGDVRSMPAVPTESFDCVFCIYVLEHVDDVEAGVAEIWRVLKRGGVLIFGLPLDYIYHGGPMDFWRFSEAGTRHLLKRFRIDSLLACGEDHQFTIDPRLKFYGPQVQNGPLGYVGAAIKPAA